MSYLLSAERIGRLREQFAAGNPYVLYPSWYASTWGTNPMGWAYIWAATGDEEAKMKALEFHAPYYGVHGNYRQDGVYAIAMHDLFKLMGATPERLLQLEFELKDMVTSAIRQVRSWDADEREAVVVMAAMMDERFGTSYLTADSTDPSSPYYCESDSIPKCVSLWAESLLTDGADGATSESIMYMINTKNIVLFGLACLKDLSFVPGLKEWLPKFAKFLLWIQSKDCGHVLVYGDAQESLSEDYQQCLWYRLPLLWLMVGLDQDPGGHLADLAVRFAEKRARGKITSPNQLHAILNWGAFFVTDFSKIPLEGPRSELPTGFMFFKPGITIHRGNEGYFYSTITAPLRDDHDYSSGVNYRFYNGKELTINCPLGYATDWTSHNSAAIKGYGWFPDRGTDVSELMPDGKVHVRGHHRGPVPSMVWSIPPLFDYVDCEMVLDLIYDPATFNVQVAWNWKHKGVFPDPSWSQYYPDLRQYKPFESQQYVQNLTPVYEGEKVTWVTPLGQVMEMLHSGSEEVEFTPWVFREIEYFKRFRLKSERQEGNHSLLITHGNQTDPVPPPPLQWVDEPVPDDQLPAPADLIVVDNKSLGYDAVGGWIIFPGQGVDERVDYVVGGDGTSIARWRARVVPGTYNISTIWEPMINRATNAPFTIKIGGKVLSTLIVNQELAPKSFKDQNGIWWHTLSDITVTEEGILEVELNNKADDNVIADAVRFEKITTTPESIFPMSFEGGKYVVDKDEDDRICLFISELHEQD